MGDIIKKKNIKSIEERAAEREERKQKNVHTENETIENMVKKPGGKDKAISARVNGTTYTNFKKICAARGITSNSALNMLISDFVIANKHIIEQ